MSTPMKEARRFFPVPFVFVLISLLASCVAHEQPHARIERMNYEKLGPPLGTISQAVRHGNVLYVSGMTAHGTPAQGKGMAEQASEVWKKIRMIAEAEGADLRSLVKVTMFVTDMSQASVLREELLRQYAGRPPASALVEVSRLFSPDAVVEIEAIFGL